MIQPTEKGFIYTGKNFDIAQICKCGQMFNFFVNQKGNYCIISGQEFAEVEQKSNSIHILTSNPSYFVNYFDLQTNYEEIIKAVSFNDIMLKATYYGGGIRIVRQQLYETIVSFIISACNNIKRIQGIIKRLCVNLGERLQNGEYGFPTLKSLAEKDENFFCNIGCGYRAKYLQETCKVLYSTDILQKLPTLNTIDARKLLTSLSGVGNKVADCILLFGLQRTDVFPTDTWIKKVYHLHFENGHSDEKISDFFVDLFGRHSGVAQQYLFYYQREESLKKNK